MKRFTVILAACLLLCSCAIQRPPVIQYRDSIRVEYRDRFVHDTAIFEVPVEIEKIITRDTVSHLENSFAKSDAEVSGGFLRHSLESKPQKIEVPVEVHVTDTVFYESEVEIQTETVEVEKSLSLSQRIKIGAFWWLVALAVAGWRREIWAGLKALMKIL